MKNVVIFTEGVGELILVRWLLLQLINSNDLSFDCYILKSDNMEYFPYEFSPDNSILHFRLICAGNDEKVLSTMKERAQYFLNNGFEVLGLRDMYSERYINRLKRMNLPSGKISNTVNEFYINNDITLFNEFKDNHKIHLFYSIMELEAWFIGLYQSLEKTFPLLTIDLIKSKLNLDLAIMDPEEVCFHPANKLGEILQLVNYTYKKEKSDYEKLVAEINIDDIYTLLNSNHCHSFTSLILEINRIYEDSQLAVISDLAL